MKIFSRDKYIKDMCACFLEHLKEANSWVERCDGKQVIDGMCGPFNIHDDWCIDEEEVNEPCSKYRIVIESDGKTTTARMEVSGRKVKETVAKLHPKDKFNWRTGAEIAFGRLWEKKDEDGQSAPSKPSVKEIQNALKAAKDICTGRDCFDCPLSVGGGFCFCNAERIPEKWIPRWEVDAHE